MELIGGLKETDIKDSFKIICLMAMVYIFGMMDKFIMDIGNMVNNMELVFKLMHKVNKKKDNGIMEFGLNGYEII